MDTGTVLPSTCMVSIAVLNEFRKILLELLMRRFLKEPIGIENF